ncbi:transglutaminase domain-containing protein [Sediminispirochaeta bajacaliforniensis]|uniref:transglutaminase domain-containing protein n=1 Tax=Sediminispirochaeta bajacaliforniensis TaxID=148 RepID=UPI0003785344|nr:transglutaminase domain-containing protein [Sediminispirochaeta bajacaliforniensis]
MKKYVICLIVYFSVFTLYSENEDNYKYFNLNENNLVVATNKYRTELPLQIVLDIPEELKNGIDTAPLKYIDELINYLTEWTNDDFLKIKSIHDWICLNIEYDVDAYNEGNIKLEDYFVTLRYKKAVCGGYAALFHYMVYKAGFASAIISGLTKGNSKYAIGEKKIFVRHAWNSVKINGAYYLVDVTWNAGYVKSNKFIQK